MSEWEKAQAWEANWHGNCVHSYNEERKQIEQYAPRMGLTAFATDKAWPVYDIRGKTVLDVGGGPYSLLLKCVNAHGTVVDPLPIPDWAKARYAAAGIRFFQWKAEDWVPEPHGTVFNEGWIYNCLQHCENPEAIVANMREHCTLIRAFEWIETGTGDGHLHSLTKPRLDAMFGGNGFTEQLGPSRCWFGLFAGKLP